MLHFCHKIFYFFSQVALDHIWLLLCIICLKVTTSESFCWVYGTFAYSLPFGTFSWCFAWFCKYWLDCKHFVVSTFMLSKKKNHVYAILKSDFRELLLCNSVLCVLYFFQVIWIIIRGCYSEDNYRQNT